jgi:hypothetical protein
MRDNIIQLHSLKTWERINPPPLPQEDETLPDFDRRWADWAGRRNAAMLKDPAFRAECRAREDAEKKRRARVKGVGSFAGRVLQPIRDAERGGPRDMRRREADSEYLYSGA